MTGRLYLLPSKSSLPKHAAVVFHLGRLQLVFEDTRYFGRLTLDVSAAGQLGPEPLADEFSVAYLARMLQRFKQPIKVKLLDQALVAGIGNIYASEALFRAGISPHLAANQLSPVHIRRLWRCARAVLREAIAWGSTVPLNWSGVNSHDRLFYYGLASGAEEFYHERLDVYDRKGEPCVKCGTAIQRCVQAARSTFFCPKCQR
jgi:formamidopyrimidine-DNA glycosylase